MMPKSKQNENSENDSVSESGAKISTNRIYKPETVQMKNIEVSELKTDGATQPLSYINYMDNTLNSSVKLLIQTGKIEITGHGVPGIHPQYYPTDDKREFMKIPLDPSQEPCNILRKFLEKVDKHFGSDEMKQHVFGAKWKKYVYQECVRTPVSNDADEDEDDDDDNKSKSKKNRKDGKKEYPKFDFCKMKFNIIVEDGNRVNKTKLKRINGTTKTDVTAITITDIAKEITFRSNIRVIFYFNKLWATSAPDHKTKTYSYGVGFKIMAVEYSPSISKSVNPDDIEFLSEEENASDDEVPSHNNTKVFDDESDNDNNDSDNEKKSSNKKKSKHIENDNDDNDADNGDSDSDLKSKKSKSKSKKKAKETDDSDNKKKSKKGKKKVDDDDDESEEEIEVKKSKKSKKR